MRDPFRVGSGWTILCAVVVTTLVMQPIPDETTPLGLRLLAGLLAFAATVAVWNVVGDRRRGRHRPTSG